MRRTKLGAFIVLVSLLFATGASAGQVFFDGDVGVGPFVPVGGTGTIEVRFNLDWPHNLEHGGVEMDVKSSNPNLIKFTSVQITDPPRWAGTPTTFTEDLVNLVAYSILTPGLPTGGQDVLFATIQYERVGKFGISRLSFIFGDDALVDGKSPDVVVTDQYYFESYFVAWIPEPGSLTLAITSLIGLVLRRRHG